MSQRTFPGPWRVEPTVGGHFVIKDATGFSVCYVYARRDEALRSSYMTPAEAFTIAAMAAPMMARKGLEGIVSKRALSPYRSGPSKFWLKTENVVESELILLGTDYDNEGKPIVYLGREAEGELQFAGTAFLTLGGEARERLQEKIEKLATERPPVPQRVWRRPRRVRPELRVRVRHLAGGATLRHGSVQAVLK